MEQSGYNYQYSNHNIQNPAIDLTMQQLNNSLITINRLSIHNHFQLAVCNSQFNNRTIKQFSYYNKAFATVFNWQLAVNRLTIEQLSN